MNVRSIRHCRSGPKSRRLALVLALSGLLACSVPRGVAASCQEPGRGSFDAVGSGDATQGATKADTAAEDGPRNRSTRPAFESDEPAGSYSPGSLTDDPGPGWTLEQCEALAFSHSPVIAEAQAAIQALEGKRVQVGLRPNPHFGFSGQQLFSRGEAEQLGLYVGQRIIRGGKLEWNRAVVCGEIDEATQHLIARQQRLLTDVRLGFYAVLIAQQRLSVLDELVKLAEENSAAVDRLLQADEASRVDLLRAQIETQRFSAQRAAARSDLEGARGQLAAVTGCEDLVQGKAVGSLDPPATELDRDEVFEFLRQQSPELLASLAGIGRAQANLQRQKVESVPDFDIQTVIQHDNATGGPNAIFQITFPVPRRDWNQGGVSQAQAELFQATQLQRRRELDLANRFAATWQQYASASARLQEYQGADGVIARSRKTLELVEEAWRAGELRSQEVLVAQRLLAESQLVLLETLAEYWAARIELEGLLLKNSLAD